VVADDERLREDMKLADTIYFAFGGGGGDVGMATLPEHGHPERYENTKRGQKGGPDKGGIVAGGPGSGRHPWAQHAKEFAGVLKKHGIENNLAKASEKDFYSQGGSIQPKFGGRVSVYGDGSWVHHSEKAWSGRRGTLPKDIARGSGAKELDVHLSKGPSKTNLTATGAAPSEGSSKVGRSYRVVDYQGRVLHKFRTKEEAEGASQGNRYTKVTTQIPADKTPEVRDMIRKRPKDTQIRTFRRSIPYPNSPYPQGPSGGG
jgi:hypothetical protein